MRLKSRPTNQAEPDLTPMIDMVFQLIAFFMVLVNFSQTEANDHVKLPSSELVKPVDEMIDYAIIVHVGADGRIYIGGDEYTLDTVSNRLRSEIAVFGAQRDFTPSDTNVIIRAHRDVAAGHVQELIRVAQDRGLENFALRVKEDRS